MKNFFDNILTWAKANMIFAIGILLAVVVLLFPKLLKGIFRTRPHADSWYTKAARERRKARIAEKRRSSRPRSRRTRSGKPLPRSVGTRRKQYTKGGKVKKPWQIKGSEAARRHMAKIRRMR